jgi:two-component system, cell cycle response regulator
MLFAVAGPQQGSVFPIHAASVSFGRDSGTDYNLKDHAVSGWHARIAMDSEGTTIEDLDSKNGTFVNGERVAARRALADGDLLRLGDTFLKFSMLDAFEEQALTRLFDLTVRDPLTNAYNRRHFDDHLRSEVAYAQRERAPLALLLVDIDHFKSVNDTWGHRMGDLVLQVIALSMQRLLRPYDLLCRFGGEEFIVVARNTTSRNAEILAERVRRRVETMPIEVAGNRISVTVSIGVVSVDPDEGCPDEETLLQTVDQALYGAKRAGRNRVVTSLPPSRTFASQGARLGTEPPDAYPEGDAEVLQFSPEHRSPAVPRV